MIVSDTKSIELIELGHLSIYLKKYFLNDLACFTWFSLVSPNLS